MKQRLEWDVDAWRRAHKAEGAVKAEPSGRAGMCRAGPAGVCWNRTVAHVAQAYGAKGRVLEAKWCRL